MYRFIKMYWNWRSLLLPSFAFGVALLCNLTGYAVDCTAGSYCSRSGQTPSSQYTAPLPSEQIPEANSGFQHPLGSVRYSTNTNGNGFAQYDGISYPLCGGLYHPAVDLNWGTGNDDCGSHIGSIAKGVVVWIGGNSDWMGIMVQHKYRGEMVIAAYGHVVEIDSNLRVGSIVEKGQYLAKVGSVGAKSCHLHMEIRKIPNHPNPLKGNFFCDYANNTSIRAYSTVWNWYQDPESYIDSHPAYQTDPIINIEAPNIVYRSWGNYNFTVGVRESGGVGTNIDWVWLDGNWYTGNQFFGNSWLPGYGSLSKQVTLYKWSFGDVQVPFQVFRWNSSANRWDSWWKWITLRP